jgi:hypothetical protein
MNRSITSAALVAAATASLLVGCGAAAEKAAEKATEQAIEEQTGGDVDIDTSGDGSVEIETEDGSMSLGTGEIPEDWPEEIPLPDDLVVQSGTTMDATDGRLVSVVGTTEETPQALLASMKEALADWEISGESTATASSGATTGAQWEKDGFRVTFAATSGMPSEDGGTFVTLGHTTLS